LPDRSSATGAPTAFGAEDAAPRGVLPLHIASTFLIYVGHAFAMLMVPLIANLRFGATPWQSFLVTASVPTLLSISIFWNELLLRWSLRRYLIVYAAMAVAPAAAYTFIDSYGQLLAIQLVTAAGLAGWSPLNGAVLKRFYPDAVRGRIFGLLNIPFMISGIGTVLFTGHLLSANPDAFRYFAVPMVGLQLVGVAMLALLLRRVGDAPPADPPKKAHPLAPILSMHRVLREDPLFRRYEAAFMTYGAGFMICDGLLPLYVTDILHLDYDEAARASHVALRVALLLCALPFGWLYDRAGPTRSCALAFGIIALYPLGLAAASGEASLAAASALYGVGMAGVLQGWMLGPVALARNAREVTHYVAIHTTLVGARGVLFQALGMILLYATGGFRTAFVVAAAAFLLAAWQMNGIDLRVRLARSPIAPPAPADRPAAGADPVPAERIASE